MKESLFMDKTQNSFVLSDLLRGRSRDVLYFSGKACPLASQTCCDFTPPFDKDIPMPSFRFCFLVSGGWEWFGQFLRLIIWIKRPHVRSCFPEFYSTYSHRGGVVIDDNFDATGDWWLSLSSYCHTVGSATGIVERMVKKVMR